MPVSQYEIVPFGDSAFLIKFKTEKYSDVVTRHIHALIQRLSKQKNWEELVPGYNSLLAYFCPAKFSPAKARGALLKALKATQRSKKVKGALVEIPVCYGGECGPDMKNIKATSGLSVKDIIKHHTSRTYSVCMMGFVPGFAFLSETPKALHHFRRDTPRASVPSGSIGIAGWQTGIYGLESPGGWQIIGRTPLQIFDSQRDEPFLLKAGDRVKFKPITPAAFKKASS